TGRRRDLAAGPRAPAHRTPPGGARRGARHRVASHRGVGAPDGPPPSAPREPGHGLPQPAPAGGRGAGEGAAGPARALRRKPERAPSLHLPRLRPDQRRDGAGDRPALPCPLRAGGRPERLQRQSSSHRVLRPLSRVPAPRRRPGAEPAPDAVARRAAAPEPPPPPNRTKEDVTMAGKP